MKIWIAGRRYFSNWDFIREELRYRLHKDDIVRTGGARGVDITVEGIIISNKFCKLGLSIKPDWSIGRHAGKLRNTEGVEWSEKVIVFWDNIEHGGTWDVIEKARERKKELIVIKISKVMKK